MRALVLIIIFISFFDLFAQLPIMSPYAKSLGASPFIIGLTVGMYSFSNTIGNVASGFLTDRHGPFRILFIGLFTTSITLFFYYFTTHPYTLLLVRFMHGLVAGLIIPAAFTFIANIAKKEQRGKSSAISGAFVGLAAILGPAFSGIVANRYSEIVVFSTIGTFMLVLSIFVFFFFRQMSIAQSKKEQRQTNVPLRNTPLIQSFLGAFFLMYAQGVLAYLLPLKVLEIGGTSQTSGLLLSTFGIVALFIFLLPINRLFDRIRSINTLVFGLSVIGGSLLMISFLSDVVSLFFIMGCYGVGFAFLFPSINSLLIEATSVDNRGKAYGYFYALFSIGVIVGSSFTGLVSKTINSGFFITGIFVIIASFLIRVIKVQKK